MLSRTPRIIDRFVSRSASLGYRLLASDTLGHSAFSGGAAVRPVYFADGDAHTDDLKPPVARPANKPVPLKV